MKKTTVLPLLLAIACSGCAPSLRMATLDGRTIRNPDVGATGFAFEIPEPYTLFDPATPIESLSGIQQVAARVYSRHEEYYPRHNEQFYQGFLFLGEPFSFLLATVVYDASTRFETLLPMEREALQHQLLPLHNVTDRRSLHLPAPGYTAQLSQGYAWERNGWFTSSPGRRRVPFRYAACKIAGPAREVFLLIGFAEPGTEAGLPDATLQMIEFLRFTYD